jgi:hypothetical protein
MSIECIKASFSDEKQALFYISKLKATSSRTKVPKRAYLCPDCLNWHLTSSDDIDNVMEAKYKQKYEGQIFHLNTQISNLKLKLENQKKIISDYYQIIQKYKNKK